MQWPSRKQDPTGNIREQHPENFMSRADPIPRDRDNDYSRELASRRREFASLKTGTSLETVGSYTIDPEVTRGNVENFIGTIQMPLGLAGPLRIVGEHAQGDFYVPLATTEGTLVASYSRGMRVISECGGVRATVVKHSMQRAPVFLFENALQARDFGGWLQEHFEEIRAAAESTTRSGKLVDIEQYPIANMLYTRFCYTTGDAAGQNMSGKATFVACEWIRAHHPLAPRFILSGAIDTDKKHSMMNMIQTRGKRVIAEFTLQRDVARQVLRIDTADLYRYRQIAAVGALQAGSAYSGAHSANGIAALFIATGQDEANVAESHAGITYGQLLENGDYYWSVTLPAVICATYGGGTGLPTQRECLEVLDCYGAGKADKFAEIIAAVVLAGDVSLTSAVLAGDWVTSHEAMGRNR
jgi:hydroxymethylglutaryl-CoA reductase (NADPH)